jgi:hypothetical protein
MNNIKKTQNTAGEIGYRKNYNHIYKFVSSLPVFSDHEHHQTNDFFTEKMSMDRLFQNGYTSWTGFVPDGTEESRKVFLDNVRFNSYYVWFEKGIQWLHGFDEPITVENWGKISQGIEQTYRNDKDFHWKALMNNGYEKLIQDSHWNPGDNEGHDEILIPAFRIDKFMHGYHAEVIAPDEFKTWERYGFEGGTLTEYVDMMKHIITKQYLDGKVAAL